MSSSTSNSRKYTLKLLVVIIVGMGAAMAIIRGVTYANNVNSGSIMGRVLEALDAVPRIVQEEEPLVMAFGSSMTEAAFSARRFDRLLAERDVSVKSFNFGFGGLNPYFQDFLSRRIRDGFVKEDRRLKLVLVEFTPLQITQARYQGAVPAIDSFLTMLATDQELWEITREDPTRGVRMFNIRYFRDQISAEMITSHFGDPFRPDRPRSDLPEDKEAEAIRDEIGAQLTERFEQDYPDYDGSDWSYAWQGAGTIPEERSEGTVELLERLYEAARTPRIMEDDRLRRVHCCDVVDLDFEEILIEAFIRTVRNFQEFSDTVEVVLTPRNTDWINYPPEAQARLQATLDRVARETGATIRNLQLIDGIDATSFSDTTHLTRYGGELVYTDYLVDLYEPLLAR